MRGYRRIVFDKITFGPVQKRFRCPRCSKSVRRQKTFMQTHNPWNRAKDGHIRSRVEILEELSRIAREWKISTELCGECVNEKTREER